MRALNRVFDRVLVFPFYQAHTVAFAFFFLVMFGSIDGSQLVYVHYSILKVAFSSSTILALFMLIWSLYMVNALHSIYMYLSKTENQFLYLSAAASPGSLVLALLRAIVLIDTPVIIYVMIGIGVGLERSFLVTSFTASAFLIVSIGAQVWLLRAKVLNTHRLPLFRFSFSLFNIRYKPSIFSITLRHLIQERKMLLIGVKLFSCMFIYAAHYEWSSFDFDIRWMEIALGPAMAAHGLLMLGIWRFDIDSMAFTRGFPEWLAWRYLQILLLTSLLLLPEALLLLSYSVSYHIVLQFPLLLLFMISFPMLHYALLYGNEFDSEGYNTLLGVLVVVSFVACLFSLGWLLALVFLLVSFVVFRLSYYAFEKKIG